MNNSKNAGKITSTTKQPLISKFFRSTSNNQGSQIQNTNNKNNNDGKISVVIHDDNSSDELGPIISNISTQRIQKNKEDTGTIKKTNFSSFKYSEKEPNTKTILKECNEKETPVRKRRKLAKSVSPGIESNDITDTPSSKSDSTKKLVKNGKKSTSELTPFDKQFKELKLQHMDKILAVQVGYKYKFFAQDAVLVSQLLHNMLVPGKLTLDDSNPQDKLHKKFAYCSIPDNRLHIHLQKLIHYNLKIGIVEQVESSAIRKTEGTTGGTSSSQVFERKLTSVITKATYFINGDTTYYNKNDSARSKYENTIWALNIINNTGKPSLINMISIELTSGMIVYDEFEDDPLHNYLETRLKHLHPVEIILNEEKETMSEGIKNWILKIMNNDTKFYKVKINSESEHSIEELLLNLSAKRDISKDKTTLLFEENKNYRETFQILYTYLETFNLQKILKLFNNYKEFKEHQNYMILPGNVLQGLDIFENSTNPDIEKGTLLWVMDHTRTPYGFRKLKGWIAKPLTNITDINCRLDAIDCIKDEVSNIFYESLNKTIKESGDLLRILNRINYGNTSRKEVYFFLKNIVKLVDLFRLHSNYLEEQVYAKKGGRICEKSALLVEILSQCDSILNNSKVPQFLSMINAGAVMDKNIETQTSQFFNLNNYDNSEPILSRQRDIEDVKNDLHEELLKIRKILKRPALNFKDEIDYLIEVRNTQVKNLPPDWVKISNTKTISRFRTPEVRKLVETLKYKKELLIQINKKEYKDFLARINEEEYDSLYRLIDYLATYDCVLSLAATSTSMTNSTRPKFIKDSKQYINIKNGRNPIIESLRITNYVPNDIKLSSDSEKIMIITGPNMGGKSSYIRQVALLIIMAQIGCYIPADFCELSIFDSIFIRIGAQDDLLRGNSTFQIEMLDVLQILENFTERSLLLLDEVGRGTGTIDGMSISYAILRFFLELEDKCPIVLYITHYPLLIDNKTVAHDSSCNDRSGKLVGVYHMGYIEQKIDGEDWPTVVFLYRLKKGLANNSYGLNVAKLAHIDKSIINRAHEISTGLKDNFKAEQELLYTKKMLSLLISNKEKTFQEKITELLNNF
ncbi:related to DNA mismatch repair protein MSH3 [Saccharomycodes ludwigii]|uniref:DNA mismatch repair protein MSH3 n=1 Tax=Saccharomycodes ludwigii TaxID=36035 RepID=A0A376B2Q7_9ASCO|nr:hypothetical protein SCDLUD_003773 [Saccharomycodes ludwigii]KAH3900768.1 hypothetical protein SCDLUD_003773 [Saccharomycodes ludwigii]SSD58931.1 related to DNA mismatch repair protein MSH3 [Saccharomycodes ludwigii]